jgi:hypothetical protein
MLVRLSSKDRFEQLAQQAIETTGGGGEVAWQLWESWVRDDEELMTIITTEALRARAISTISAHARYERQVIKAGAGDITGETEMGAPLSPKILKGLATTAQLLLSHLTLPIPGNPRLSEATCSQVHDAIDYKQSQLRPGQVDVKKRSSTAATAPTRKR